MRSSKGKRDSNDNLVPSDIDDYGENVDDPENEAKAETTYRLTPQEEEDAYFNRAIVKEYTTEYRACDKKANLYLLQQDLFMSGERLPPKAQSNCSRLNTERTLSSKWK